MFFTAIMGTLSFFAVPAELLLAAMAFGSLLALVGVRGYPPREFRRGHRSARTALRAAASALVYALLLPSCGFGLTNFLYSMWLPHEDIVLATKGSAHEVGYVLDDSNSWMTILRSGERRIIRVRDSDVLSRRLCEAGPPGEPILDLSFTLWDQLVAQVAMLRDLEKANMPACPSSSSGGE
jgi:hypothetical protein